MNNIEIAQSKKEKIAKQYNIAESQIVWIGVNNFIVIIDGTEQKIECK